MKVGIITQPNAKGQVVIPKEFREALGIKKNISLNMMIRGNGIYIYPVFDVTSAIESEPSYLKILEMTRGEWKGEEGDKARARKRKFEISASKKRKEVW